MGRQVGITAWRQSHSNTLKVKALLRTIEKLWHQKPKGEDKKVEKERRIIEATRQYLKVTQDYVDKAKLTISILREMGILDLFNELKLLQV